jgi:CubicO group peptidase (beta-lactamase class C family)
MRIRPFAVAALALVAARPAAAQPDPATRVDSAFAAWNARTPGCAVGVAQNGRTLLSRAYGMADLEHDVPNTPATVFEAGSVSKQFTAAAVVLLAQQGRLSLDDDVRRWIPEVPDYGTTITLRHLLNHTSGLRDWGTVMELAGWPRGSRIYTHPYVLEIISRQRKLNFTPGAEYLYSNTGYNLLAMVVARVSGVSFAEFTRRELFAPLGMTRTQWRDDFTRVVPGRAIAYAPHGNAYHQQMPFENVHGNGGLLTTVDDLLRWNQALDSGRIAGLDTLETRGELTSGRRIAYALGLFVGQHRGAREVSHSGATAGYRAFLARYPEHGFSVAVLCNAAMASPTQLAYRVVDAYIGGELRSTAIVSTAQAPPAPDPRMLERRMGTYRSRRTGEPLRVMMGGGALRIEGGPFLSAEGPDVFRAGSARLEFVDVDGRSRLLRMIDADADTMEYERVNPGNPTAAQLAAYAGEYRSVEAEAGFTALVVDGRLVLRQRADVVITLTPAYADGFSGPGGSVIRFVRGTDGRVRALTITVERVRNLRFDRVR